MRKKDKPEWLAWQAGNMLVDILEAVERWKPRPPPPGVKLGKCATLLLALVLLSPLPILVASLVGIFPLLNISAWYTNIVDTCVATVLLMMFVKVRGKRRVNTDVHSH